MLAGAALPTQVIVLRWMASLLASVSVPLLYLVGRAVFRDERLALGCAAILAVMPEFALDVARVGNDCLAVPLFALLIFASVKLAQDGLTYRYALLAGAALGLGLFSKAYFLTALPVVACVYAYAWRRSRGPRLGPLGCALLLPAALAGWWYARNVSGSGTLSGMVEAAATRNVSFFQVLAHAASVNWLKVTDGVLLSYLYFGGWSSLTVRAWMYHVFYVAIAAAALGLALRVRGAAFACLAGFYLCFWAGQYYQAALLSLSVGVAASMGWYAYAVAAAEIPLAVAGLHALALARARDWVAPAGVLLFALLDLFAMHAIAMPYYTGMVAHKANGAVAGLRWADLRGFGHVFERLAAFKGPLGAAPVIAVLWLAYLTATVMLALLSLRSEWGGPPGLPSSS